MRSSQILAHGGLLGAVAVLIWSAGVLVMHSGFGIMLGTSEPSPTNAAVITPTHTSNASVSTDLNHTVSMRD